MREELEELIKNAEADKKDMEEEHSKEKTELTRLRKDLAIRMEEMR